MMVPDLWTRPLTLLGGAPAGDGALLVGGRRSPANFNRSDELVENQRLL